MKRITGLLAACMLALSIAQPVTYAETEKTFSDESIYDLLVDRFNNGLGTNDFDVNAQDPHAFNGGDFAGISNRLQHLIDMHFTMISMGPVFKTATYDGNQVLDYTELEPHFGTSEEFTQLLSEMHEADFKVMADFPLGNVSADHIWADKLASAPAEEGTIDWDLGNTEVQDQLIGAAVQFVKEYKLDGLRLTKLKQADTAFLDRMIEALKNEREGLYVITNEASDASFDSMPAAERSDAIQESFVQVDPDSSAMDQFSNENANKLLQFDDLTGPRFTYKMVELRQFPPTRWKVATAAQFMLPGVPLVPYATEIAVNGKEAPESHPFFNFKTDMELHEWIGDLNTLRNDSDTLRNGDFRMLHNEGGFTVFERSSEKEKWIIAINNTSEVQSLEIDPAEIGEKKKLRGVLGQDLVKETKDHVFHVVLDRELAEIYIVEEDEGFNTPYLIASILVYVFFLSFLFAIFRKGRQRKKDEKLKRQQETK
ncbi:MULTISPECIES: alpha-amylase family glycosyl hydrolase [unclassified Sporosarcina]|uniref:alpha-amylase family glycosyl hydrolase n=1 Tax=unclassified Sporosarcina TaxID=2647733 RepID=UPI00203DF3A6|nr:MULTISPECIES: alpha-amylase family glycosyl hydrolase [unclassified Sporosarcina]GKV65979.1 alpha-amylase [Sporosarcina sp. NCCP-2331]GLB57789.1 alpha-amylase [Sporosarcina sp. NCCP-2378]